MGSQGTPRSPFDPGHAGTAQGPAGESDEIRDSSEKSVPAGPPPWAQSDSAASQGPPARSQMPQGHPRDQPESESLLAEVYDELRALAEGYLRGERPGHTLQPTALVHEAFLRLAAQDPSRWKGSAHFIALAATVMRRVLVDHARRRGAAKRGGQRQRVTLADLGSGEPEVDLLALDEALTELATLSARQVRVVELRFFGGLSLDDVADQLEIAPSTAALDWRMARAWLNQRLSERSA